MRKTFDLSRPVPGIHSSELPAQSLNAIGEFGMILPYYMNSGDASVIAPSYPAVINYLRLWETNADSLIEPRKGDWYWYEHGEKIDGDVLRGTIPRCRRLKRWPC
ncbi:hypothetical protein J4772_04675 [Cohnella sp. LGH]|uniref:hypothetical protein n=1 Tax=Cohnella sp. LGH TaxID=1619153 RepID=UPI001ADD5294|nr:hypothetical protein [Cohnella sp. LGH]QTH43723.1 hypothetical protein J4772_04675 [Cohnella sp. LGH]